MVDASNELRTTSDIILLDLQALADLEEQKRGTPQGDPKLVDLAAKVEELAQRVLAGTRRQRRLTEAVNDAADSGELVPTDTIDAMRSVSAILTEWREAERGLRDTPPDSLERAEAEAVVDRLREEYRMAFEAARRESD